MGTSRGMVIRHYVNCCTCFIAVISESVGFTFTADILNGLLAFLR